MIRFIASKHRAELLCSFADTENEQARGEWIEGPRVSNFRFWGQELFDVSDAIIGRNASGLIYKKKSIHGSVVFEAAVG